jgi:hypothetical protein
MKYRSKEVNKILSTLAIGIALTTAVLAQAAEPAWFDNTTAGAQCQAVKNGIETSEYWKFRCANLGFDKPEPPGYIANRPVGAGAPAAGDLEQFARDLDTSQTAFEFCIVDQRTPTWAEFAHRARHPEQGEWPEPLATRFVTAVDTTVDYCRSHTNTAARLCAVVQSAGEDASQCDAFLHIEAMDMITGGRQPGSRVRSW